MLKQPGPWQSVLAGSFPTSGHPPLLSDVPHPVPRHPRPQSRVSEACAFGLPQYSLGRDTEAASPQFPTLGASIYPNGPGRDGQTACWYAVCHEPGSQQHSGAEWILPSPGAVVFPSDFTHWPQPHLQCHVFSSPTEGSLLNRPSLLKVLEHLCPLTSLVFLSIQPTSS